MKRLGLLMIVMGALSFLLPLVGMQFQIFALFGEAANAVALLAIGAGIVLFLIGALIGPRAEDDAPEPEDRLSQNPDEFVPTGQRVAQTAEGSCPHCGAIAERSDEFCGDCGEALRHQAPPVAMDVGTRKTTANGKR